MPTRTVIKVAYNILLAFLSGCALSLNPIVSGSNASFDLRLIGSWKVIDGSEWATISRADSNTYAIEYIKGDRKPLRCEARLGNVGKRLVLDVWPTPGKEDVPDSYKGVLVSGHLFFILNIGSDEFTFTILGPDSLLAALRANRIRLPYSQSKDQFILLASSEELQSVLGPYFEQPGALPNPRTWRRAVRSGTPAPRQIDIPCFEASAWGEADQLFRRDPSWVGGDGASSVDLGNGRILWLFGDSWIDPSGMRRRSNATIVSNTVAIQIGTDPAHSSISFYWSRAAGGKPAPFIPDEGNAHHWFGNGVRVGDRLILFLNKVISTNAGMGFESIGWAAWMVDNPDDEPTHWRKRRLLTPANSLGVLVGFAAVLHIGEYVYAFGSEDPVKSHPIYAVRWTVEDVCQGRLMSPEWWAGQSFGWITDTAATARHPLFENGRSELSIHFDQISGTFIGVQTSGSDPADLMMRAAPSLTGPWSPAKLVYRPSDYYKPDIAIYSAKAHPGLTGGDLILTYDTNHFDFAALFTDSTSYYPRFVRLMRCK